MHHFPMGREQAAYIPVIPQSEPGAQATGADQNQSQDPTASAPFHVEQRKELH